MKFRIEQRDFAAALHRVVPTAARQTTMPILTHVLVQARDNKLTLTASDIIARAVTTVPADVIDAGSMAVPARDMLARVSNLQGQVIAAQSGDKIMLKAGPRKYMLETLPADIYPNKAGATAETTEIALPAKALCDGILTVAHAAHQNETRTNMHCVAIHSCEGGLRIFAIDGHRFFAVYGNYIGPQFSLALQPDRAREFAGLLEGVDGDVKLHVSLLALAAESPTGEFSTALPNVQPPPIDVVLEQYKIQYTAQCPREALAKSLKALTGTTDNMNSLTIALSAGTMQLSTQSGEDEVPVEYSGKEETISVNLKYIADAVAAIPDEEFNLSLTSLGSDDITEGVIKLHPVTAGDWVAGAAPRRS